MKKVVQVIAGILFIALFSAIPKDEGNIIFMIFLAMAMYHFLK